MSLLAWLRRGQVPAEAGSWNMLHWAGDPQNEPYALVDFTLLVCLRLKGLGEPLFNKATCYHNASTPHFAAPPLAARSSAIQLS